MTIGTKSVLFGAHCFFLHPFFVARAWWKLYGFPFDPRLWAAFFVHDLGYIGKPNMDGPEGETHPLFGARIMHALFDWKKNDAGACGEWYRDRRWNDFVLLHSRYYAKKLGKPFSRLCVADKLAFVLTPCWMYLPMVHWSGEIHEYLKMAKNADTATGRFAAADYSANVKAWHVELCRYMGEWVSAHKDGAHDTWTSVDRHARTESGVQQ